MSKYVKGGLFLGVKFADYNSPLFKALASTGGYYQTPQRTFYLKSIAGEENCLVGFRIFREYQYINSKQLIEICEELTKTMENILINVSRNESLLKSFGIKADSVKKLKSFIGLYSCFGEFKK